MSAVLDPNPQDQDVALAWWQPVEAGDESFERIIRLTRWWLGGCWAFASRLESDKDRGPQLGQAGRRQAWNIGGTLGRKAGNFLDQRQTGVVEDAPRSLAESQVREVHVGDADAEIFRHCEHAGKGGRLVAQGLDEPRGCSRAADPSPAGRPLAGPEHGEAPLRAQLCAQLRGERRGMLEARLALSRETELMRELAYSEDQLGVEAHIGLGNSDAADCTQPAKRRGTARRW